MKYSKAFLFCECCFVLAMITIFVFDYPINWFLWFFLCGVGWIVHILDWKLKKDKVKPY